MRRLNTLWRVLAQECASRCGTSTARDYETVASRVEAEGESFLTITLPQYAKAFERALETGALDSRLFSSFKKRGGLPLFLGGFLSQIFDPSGLLLKEPSVDCIRSVFLLTKVFGKIERQCSDARIARAMRQFFEIEKELVEFDTSSLEEEIFPLFRQASTLLWADVFSFVENSLLDRHQLAQDWMTPHSREVSHKLRRDAASNSAGRTTPTPMDLILGISRKADLKRLSEASKKLSFSGLEQLGDCEIVDPSSLTVLVPKHGPGATADRLRGNAKYSVSKWPLRLERYFPYGDYALPQLAHHDELDRVEFLEPGAEMPVKVIPVPKTDKTPRIIAIEPTAMQYTQQALACQFVNRIEHAVKFPPPFGGKEFDLGKWFIGFEDQEVNRLMAQEGSLNGSLATLDLSEASDRVLNSHVLLLFERFPHLREAIQTTRSTHADVPGQGVIPLSKFASMGSALCFPIEAMVFTTIVIAAIAYERRTPVNRKLLLELRGKVRVYGDDIVVPVDCVQRVIQFLEAFGLKVNKDKSFWNGKFRESCGGDYYDGEWVTPIRLRHELPRSLADVDEVVGLVAFRNLLYWGGYWKTAASIDDRLSVLLKGRWKIGDVTSAGLVRQSVLPYQAEWIDSKLHEPRIAGAIVRSKTPKSMTSGSGSLLKFLIKRGTLPSQDSKHLERQGRPSVSRIKLKGIRPY